MVIAKLETQNFFFEGVGNNNAEALKTLLRILKVHGKQYHCRLAWASEFLGDGNENATYREVQPGQGYRDGELVQG